MNKLNFALRAFGKCGITKKSIQAGTIDSEMFERYYLESLKMTIHDTRGREFLTNLPLRQVPEDSVPGRFRGDNSPLKNHKIYYKPQEIVAFVDDKIPENSVSAPFSVGDIYNREGQPYFQVFDGTDIYIASPLENLSIYGAVLIQNLGYWSAKSIEAAITYCGYLLAPVFRTDDKSVEEGLLKQYLLITGQYKTMDTSISRYPNVPSSYGLNQYDSSLGGGNLPIPYRRG